MPATMANMLMKARERLEAPRTRALLAVVPAALQARDGMVTLKAEPLEAILLIFGRSFFFFV